MTLPDPDGAGPLAAPETEYVYDSLSLLIAIIDPLDNETSYVYDAAGRVLSVADAAATYEFQYDSLGRVVEETQTLAGLTPVIVFSYQYSAVGLRTQTDATIGGVADAVTDYLHDPLGRVTRVEQYGVQGGNAVAEKRIDLSYDAASQYAAIARYADLAGTDLVATGTYTYDNASRLVGLDYTQGVTSLVEYSWAFDAASRMTWYDNSIDGEVDYTHDDTNQLTDADYDYQSDENYTYDENGNRTNGGYVTGTNNQLLEDGTYRYAYDAEGNRTLRYVDTDGSDTLTSGDTDITEYEWDNRNRLTEVEHFTTYANYDAGTSDQIVDYKYDCFNRLIGRTLDSDGTSGATDVEQSIYVYENGQVVMQFDKTGSGDLAVSDMTHRYLWNPQAVDQLLADEQIHFSTVNFYTDDLLWALTDHQNSVRDLAVYDEGMDETTIALHRVMDAFGNETSTTGSAECLFEHTGTLRDAATGLDYHRTRWYEPSTGRWASEDHIWDGTNLYAYVGNNPTTNTDSTGYCKDGDYSDLVYRGEAGSYSAAPYRIGAHTGQTWAYAGYSDLVDRGGAVSFQRGPYVMSDSLSVAYAGYNTLVDRGEVGSYQRGPYIVGTGGSAMYAATRNRLPETAGDAYNMGLISKEEYQYFENRSQKELIQFIIQKLQIDIKRHELGSYPAYWFAHPGEMDPDICVMNNIAYGMVGIGIGGLSGCGCSCLVILIGGEECAIIAVYVGAWEGAGVGYLVGSQGGDLGGCIGEIGGGLAGGSHYFLRTEGICPRPVGPERTPNGIRFGQQGMSSTFRNGEFAGKTIDQVAAGLRSGAITPSQLPITTITRDGVTYTLNNRSLMALRLAGKEPTVIIDVTGNPFFEQQLTTRLSEIGSLDSPDFVPPIRKR